MDSSAEQNSAVVLSLWHCMLSRFYANTANNPYEGREIREQEVKAMTEIYSLMSPLRYTIHGKGDPHGSIFRVAHEVNFIASRIIRDEKVWVNELHSMMQDLEVMNQVLKDYKKQSLDSSTTGLDDKSKLHAVQVWEKPKETICLLTLWYWLAAWSTPDSNQPDENDSAKHKFMASMEAHYIMLGSLLVKFYNPHAGIPHGEEFEGLYFKLLEMLKSDPQHWTNVLDHFLDKMVDAGLLRGQVKEVLHTGGAIKSGSTMLLATTGAPNTMAMPMLSDTTIVKKSMKSKLASKIGGILKDGLKQLAIGLVLDKLADVVVHIYHDIEKGLESFYESIKHMAEEVGPVVVDVAMKVVHGAEEVGRKIVDVVKHLAHKIGEGIHKFAAHVQTAYHSVAHFFSHLFGG